MKNEVNHALEAKKSKLTLFVLVLCSLFVMPNRAEANDYLEKQNHYSVMATGQDVIHFVVPVYAYGKCKTTMYTR